MSWRPRQACIMLWQCRHVVFVVLQVHVVFAANNTHAVLYVESWVWMLNTHSMTIVKTMRHQHHCCRYALWHIVCFLQVHNKTLTPAEASHLISWIIERLQSLYIYRVSKLWKGFHGCFLFTFYFSSNLWAFSSNCNGSVFIQTLFYFQTFLLLAGKSWHYNATRHGNRPKKLASIRCVMQLPLPCTHLSLC